MYKPLPPQVGEKPVLIERATKTHPLTLEEISKLFPQGIEEYRPSDLIDYFADQRSCTFEAARDILYDAMFAGYIKLSASYTFLSSKLP